MRFGSCRLYDSTRVQARAAVSTSARAEVTPQETPEDFLLAFEWQAEKEEQPRRKQKIVINTNDPEARLLSYGKEPARFVHKVHFGVDSKTGLVMDAVSTHRKEHLAMLEMLRREERRVESIGADKGYSTVECFRELEYMGIEAFIPVLDHANDKGNKYHLSDFTHLEESDIYICPAGKALSFGSVDRKKRSRTYYAKAQDCCMCPLRTKCLSKGKRRVLSVSEDRPLIERMKLANQLPKHSRIMNRRKAVIEGTNAHSKNWHGMSKARGIGSEAMEIQALMVGAVINVEKLLAHLNAQVCPFTNSAVGVTRRLLAGLERALERLISSIGANFCSNSDLNLSRC